MIDLLWYSCPNKCVQHIEWFVSQSNVISINVN